MLASRPYKYQKSTKNKTQNRLDLIYRTSLKIIYNIQSNKHSSFGRQWKFKQFHCLLFL